MSDLLVSVSLYGSSKMKILSLFKWVFVITTIILSAIVSVILIVPTECVNPCNTQYAEMRLLSDLSISN